MAKKTDLGSRFDPIIGQPPEAAAASLSSGVAPAGRFDPIIGTPAPNPPIAGRTSITITVEFDGTANGKDSFEYTFCLVESIHQWIDGGFQAEFSLTRPRLRRKKPGPNATYVQVTFDARQCPAGTVALFGRNGGCKENPAQRWHLLCVLYVKPQP